jgi:hypothetical protein
MEAVGLTEFRQDMTSAERAYRESTDHMSDSAIKLGVAQDRLRRALDKGPRALNEQRRALLSVRQAEREVAAETARTTHTIDLQDSALGRLRRRFDGLSQAARAGGPSGFVAGGRGAAGGGLIGGLAGGLTGGLLGAGGALYALDRFVDAAAESQQVLGQTRLALESAGGSWDTYGDRIEQAIQQQSKLGFDDEALLRTFGVFVRRTKDVEEALRLNALAADVARGRYIDLEQAQNIVLKASIGMGGQLRRLGLDVRSNATAQELLNRLTEEYGGAAERSVGDAIASQERLKIAIENSRESLGELLLPGVSLVADEFARATANATGLVDALKRGDAQASGSSLLGILRFTSPYFAAGSFAADRISGLFGDDPGPQETPKSSGPGGPGNLAESLAAQKAARERAEAAQRRARLQQRFRDVETAALRAQLTETLADDRKAAQDRVGLYRQLIDEEKLTGKKLADAKNDLLRAQLEVRRVEEAIDAARLAGVQAAAEARAARAEKLRQQRAALAERERQGKAHADRVERARLEREYRNDLIDAGASIRNPNLVRDPVTGKTKTATTVKTDAIKEDEMRRMLDSLARDLITGFAEIQRKYAPNFQLGTHVLQELTREQTGVLRDIARPRRFRDSAGLAEHAEAVMS